jgi:hypothetical protein
MDEFINFYEQVLHTMEVTIMGAVLFDLSLLGALIIGITALIGVISSTIGLKFLSRGEANHHLDHSMKTQTGWKEVGGKK